MDATFKPHQLCSTCSAIVAKSDILNAKSQEIEPQEDTVSEELEYRREVEDFPHLNKEALLRSAETGCHLCSLLYEQHTQSGLFINDSQPLALKVEREFSYMGPGAVSLYLQAAETTPPGISLLVHTGPYTSSELDDEVDRLKLGSGTSSDGWFDKIALWLSTCQEQHLNCRIPVVDAELPARLIDVGTSGSDVRPPRLCLSSTMRQRPQYLTLSHCWGGAKFLRLLQENHDQFLDHLPEDELPATFRDAVAVTRRLGYHYLWIDSLCIIQDSESDWVTESAKMGDVYRYADLTISALWGENSYSGLFTRRNPLSFQDCIVNVQSRPVRIQGLSRKGVPLGPLLRRGWVFQERALCSRTLFYSKGTVFWECLHCDASEDSETLLHPLDLDSQGSWVTKQLVQYMAKGSEKGLWKDGGSNYGFEQSRMHHFWCQLRDMYRVLDFTFNSDRLVAIQGVLAAVGLADNVAGLARNMLLPELLWDADRVQSSIPFKDRVGREPYIAPSWPWASVGEAWGIDHYFSTYLREEIPGVLTPTQDIRPIQWAAEVLDINMDQKRNGQVTGGYLQIRAPLTKMIHGFDLYNSWFPDTRRESPALIIGDKFALLVARVGQPDTSLDTGHMDFCLVLERNPARDNTFFRIGILWQDSTDPGPGSIFCPLLSDCQTAVLNLE